MRTAAHLARPLALVACVWLAAGCEAGTISGDEDGSVGSDGSDGVDEVDGAVEDGAVDGHDSSEGGDEGPQPGHDTDGDGLDDAWEFAAGDPGLLDWREADSDGDGQADGQEDPDADGLTNLQEQAAAGVTWRLGSAGPLPLQADLLVEVDAMQGRAPADALLAGVAEAYLASSRANPDGSRGVGVHFLLDELDLAVQDMDGSFEQRFALLRDHPPARHPELPASLRGELIHLMVVVRRTDVTGRGGEVVATTDGDAESTGVLIYRDTIEEIFPACAGPDLPAITADEMIISTMVHELGHCLQLGHDTDAGGGTNFFNIMSVPQSCAQAQMRAHGADNFDPALGATEDEGVPRFSNAAAALMRLTQKLSVEESALLDDDGFEM